MTQTDVERKMTKARTALLLDHPWFGSLALRLRMQAVPGIGTMATDGTSLIYDPTWVDTLSPAVLQGCIAHEVLHCALLHPFRRGNREPLRFNMAADYAINPMIVEAGMQLPAGILNDPQYAGLSAEQIYARLPEPEPDPQSGGKPDPNGKPGNKPGGTQWGIGQDLKDAPKPQPKPKPQPGTGDPENGEPTPGDGEPAPGDSDTMTREDWERAVEQTTLVTQKAGKAPASIVRQVQKARQSVTDWRTILHRFVEQVVPSDYSWTRPNRRHMAEGMYMPGMTKENFPKIGIGIDTSGSIGSRELGIYAAELDRIMRELRPAELEIVYCDSEVNHVDRFDPDGSPVTLKPHGGGGTAFQPVLDHFNKQGEPPAAVIYFTDLYGPKPRVPEYPVLWVTSERSGADAPFGELVRVEPE